MLKGHLEPLLLSVLAKGPAHGYAITESLKVGSEGEFDLPEGTTLDLGPLRLQDGDRVTMTPTKIEGATRLLFINNDGGGFADYVDMPAGTTVDKFFSQQLPGRDPQDYLIRVNRQPAARDYVLQDNDRVTMTPVKIEGAAA